MKEGLYIDVVSKTIISRLSESIAQLVGDNLSEEIKKVLLTKLPGLIGDEISPALSKAREDAQETAKKSEKKVLEQLKAIKGQVDKSLKAHIRNELTPIQKILADSASKKEDNDLHEKIINLIQKLVSAHDQIKVDVEELQSQSKQKIAELNAWISDLEHEKAELNSALNQAIASAENLQLFSQKEIAKLKTKIDELENEKADQELYVTRDLADINALKNQMVTINEELTKNKIIVENAVQEKIAMENKLAAIQELWEKQQMN